MIPRYQSVLFFVLLAASIIMGAALWQLRNHAHQRLLAGEQTTPTQAPQVAPAEQATLMVANDTDDSLNTQSLTLPLPQSQGARAKAILGKLLDLYTASDSGHPVPGGAAAVTEVFLMPAPEAGSGAAGSGSTANQNGNQDTDQDAQAKDSQAVPEMAVVNLTGAFAASHPSGIETESLTVLSICATLHANLSRVTEVRFLVDGQPRETLSGHADLTRTYLTAEALPETGTAQ
jgi:hypothetical protein